jgi:chromosome partitioning protein
VACLLGMFDKFRRILLPSAWSPRTIKPMGHVIDIYNFAGGSAKTTVTLNLGYHLAQLGKRVALVDLDPQASLTEALGFDVTQIEQTVGTLLEGGPLETLEVHGMTLVPSNVDLIAAEYALFNAAFRDTKLKRALAPVIEAHDFVLIDSLPSMGLLAFTGLVASSELLVPILASGKGISHTRRMLDMVASAVRDNDMNLGVLAFVPTFYDSRLIHDRAALEQIRETFSPIAPVFNPITSSTVFKNAGALGKPVALYDRRHDAVKTFCALAEFVIASLEVDRGEE